MKEYNEGRTYRLAERYEILRELGRGGMGTVYLARDLKLNGKLWAIKRCRTLSNASWNNEASMLMELDHPLLPRIVDCVQWGMDHVGIVMDYIEGPTLLQLFDQHDQKLSEERWLKYIVQICEALQYLHERPNPIVYRDLKPSNVIIDSHDNARLIDFGISRVFQGDKDQDTAQLGTRGFAAPEQLLGGQSDPRTDIYQLGALIYYVMSGGRYYTFQNLETVSRNQPRWYPVLQKMLQEDPEKRFQSASEAKRSLLLLMRQQQSVHMERREKSYEPRYIAVLSAYAGAGASFTADAAALALEQVGVSCSIVEWKDSLMAGETKRLGRKIVKQQIGWEHKEEWLQRWQKEQKVDVQVLFIDLGRRFEWIEQLSLPIHNIWVVADGFPHRFNSAEAAVSFRRAESMRKLGYEVDWIANRASVHSKFRHTWLSSFPQKPICYFPNFTYEEWIEAEWEGRHILQNKKRFEQVMDQLTPIVAKISSGPAGSKKRRWFKR